MIEDLNPKLRDAYSVELRLITAENFVVPSIGLDPQSVVNSQVADEYDIYLGILVRPKVRETYAKGWVRNRGGIPKG